MEVARRRGRRRKKLLDDLKDRRGYSLLKEEALDRTMWRHRFGGGFGPVVRQNTEWMNVDTLWFCLKSETTGRHFTWKSAYVYQMLLFDNEFCDGAQRNPNRTNYDDEAFPKNFSHIPCMLLQIRVLWKTGKGVIRPNDASWRLGNAQLLVNLESLDQLSG